MADLTVPRGDKGYRLSFTVTDSDGDAYNLTGYTINLKVWRKGNSGVVLLTATIVNWIRHGEGFSIVQTLPFLGGHRTGIYDVAGIMMLLITIWGARRLGGRKRRRK